MKRNYDSKVLYTVLKKTRQIYTTHNVETKNVGTRHALSENISIGADIITGFPGETEADFLETVKGIQEFGITKLHAFPFSDHHKGETIPASNYPHQIAESTKKQRNQHLIKI
jgi:threonylcarbamoyladenosine tRNA methylthiotransferase MtaB